MLDRMEAKADGTKDRVLYSTATDLEAAMKIIEGTARSMGIEVMA